MGEGMVLTDEQIAAQFASGGQPPAPEAAAASPIEPLMAKPGDPVEVKLSNGWVVVLQKPSRPTNILLAKALGVNSNNMMLYNYYKLATWVVLLNNMRMPTPTVPAQFEGVCNMFPDEILDNELLQKMFEIEAASAVKPLTGDELGNS